MKIGVRTHVLAPILTRNADNDEMRSSTIITRTGSIGSCLHSIGYQHGMVRDVPVGFSIESPPSIILAIIPT